MTYLTFFQNCILVVAVCGSQPVLGLAIGKQHDQMRSAADKGSFQEPNVAVKPKFRYWLPDSSVSPESVASDMESIASIGAGGVEFLPYYNYGGMAATQVTDWGTYGYGTPAYNVVLKAALQASKDNGLMMDLCIGPQSGQGVPAEPDNPGLAYEMVFEMAEVALGGTYDGIIPGFGSGQLISVTTAAILKEVVVEFPSLAGYGLGGATYNRTTSKISANSLQDVTEQVNLNGSLVLSFPSNVTAEKYVVFAAYYKLTLERASTGGSNPQNFIANGSFAVDHFSAQGAKVTTDFLEQYVLVNGVKELFVEIGKYIWEDSVEIHSSLFWTPKLQQTFKVMKGYDIGKYVMLLTYNNGLGFGVDYPTQFITDDSDEGQRYVEDYRDSLTYSLTTYYQHLVDWSAHYLGVQFSAQVGNLPVDNAEVISVIDAPEDESLGFDLGTSLDLYRAYVGPSNIAGKNIISNELGAQQNFAYRQTLPILLAFVKRAWASGNNQMVFHGASYSGQYPNTTWPGFTPMAYSFGEQHSRHQPAWTHGYSDMIKFVARTQWVLQSGIPQRDVVFWLKESRSPAESESLYQFSDLEEAGYSYEYVSPSNLELPQAYVENQVLAPDGPSYKALVITSNATLTLNGTAKVVQYANQGLPIIFSGGLPSKVASASELSEAMANLNSILDLENVHQVKSGPIAATLISIGIQPLTKVSSNGTWYTTWRKDEKQGKDYCLVVSDGAEYSEGTVSFATSNQPSLMEPWTGEETPIVEYNMSDGYTIIPFRLAAGQMALVSFDDENINQRSTYITDAPSSIIGFSRNHMSGITAKIPSSNSSSSISLSNSTIITIPAQNAGSVIQLSNWTLVAESWAPPSDLYNSASLGTLSNQTFQLPTLASWPEIPGLANTSGVGYYSTSFSFDNTVSQRGAMIDFGRVVQTLRVKINGMSIPPLDPCSATADITQYLIEGQNLVEAIVATTLYNALVPIYSQLETSGGAAYAGPGAAYDTKVYSTEAGLIGTVTVTPFNIVDII